MTHLSEVTLTQRVLRLLRTVSATIWVQPPVTCLSVPGAYDPSSVPAYISVRAGLTLYERTLILVHELTHACLHRPGSDDFDFDRYMKEEVCSHESTDTLCVAYGVHDYRRVMLHLHVQPKMLLRGTDPTTVSVMVERVASALEASEIVPEWAHPIQAP